MILPDLAKRIAWYQEHLRPRDESFGPGIADWTITAEYRDGLDVDGQPIWGCMCSPSLLPELVKLTREDIESRRAHIVVRTPTTQAELAELDPTLMHELGHVLVAELELPRDKEEEIMHSLDHLFSKLTPEEGIALARAIRDPMARAYRAKDGAMPDTTNDEKKPDKPAAQEDTGEKKPAMQVRAVQEIEADLINAVLAGAPTDELAKELVAAKALAESVAPASAPEPEPAAQMGMEQQDAYARGKKDAQAEVVKLFVDNLEGVPEDRKAFLRKRGTIAEVKEALAFLPKAGPTMGFDAHPAARAKDGDDEETSVFYPSGNKSTQAAFRVMARKKDGVSARGIHKCSPQEMRETGHLMRFSLTDALPALREVAEENARRDRKSALSRIGGE